MAETCWIYAAVSSGKQEGTVEDQLAWGRGVAAAHEWKVTREFSGVATGKDGTRSIIEALVCELEGTTKAQRPRRILMVRLDRMGRGTGLDVIGALGTIYKLGVVIHTRVEGDRSIGSIAEAVVPIMEILAGATENQARSEKSRAMHARKKAAGEPVGLPPYGFVYQGKGWVPHEPEAGFVRDLFGLRLDGWGYSRLARYVAPRAPAKTLPNGTRPMGWSPSSISTILQNEHYRGAIVPEDVFDAVQATKRGQAAIPREARFPWPLRGALRCTCGQRPTGRISGAVGYRTRYYMCPNISKHGSYVSHRADSLELQFVELISHLRAHPEVLLAYSPPVDAIEELQERRKALVHERAGLEERKRKVWRIAEEGDIPPAALKSRLDELAEHEARLSSAIAEIDESLALSKNTTRLRSNAASLLASLTDLWPNSDVTTQQQIANAVASFVGGLWVDPAKRSELTAGVYLERVPCCEREERRGFTIVRNIERLLGTTLAV